MEVKVEIFFSKTFRRNITYVDTLIPFLRERQIGAQAYEVAEHAQRWAALGLKSVPAIVIMIDDQPVSDIVSYASPETVLKRVEAVARHGQDQIAARTFPPPEPRPIDSNAQALDYFVEASSGCHRYERWNEELLRTPDPTTGWCCPSAGADREFILFRLKQPALVETVLLRPRVRTDGTDPYKSFPKSLSLWALDQDGAEQRIWLGQNVRPAGLESHFAIELPEPRECERLKLVIEDKHDIDGKFFPSFTEVKILGQALGGRQPGYTLKNSPLLDSYKPNLFFKNGVFADERMSIERYNLLKDQAIPACCSSARKIIVGLHGSLRVTFDEQDEVTLQPGNLVVIEPDHSYSVRGLGEQNALLMLFSAGNLTSVWESR